MKIKDHKLYFLLITFLILLVVYNLLPTTRIKRNTISMLNAMINNTNSSNTDYLADRAAGNNKNIGFHINTRKNLIIIRDAIKRSWPIDITGAQEKVSMYFVYAGNHVIGTASLNSVRLCADDGTFSVYFKLKENDQLSIDKMIQSIRK